MKRMMKMDKAQRNEIAECFMEDVEKIRVDYAISGGEPRQSVIVPRISQVRQVVWEIKSDDVEAIAHRIAYIICIGPDSADAFEVEVI